MEPDEIRAIYGGWANRPEWLDDYIFNSKLPKYLDTSTAPVTAPIDTTPLRRLPTAEEQLAMRMRWVVGGKIPFHHISICLSPDKTVVLVWVVTKLGNNVVVKDSQDLFPSDTLVSQLRMLE